MAGIANAITSLVDALVTALNARNAPGASDYQMWLAQGNTGTLDDYRRIVAGSAMTAAQRQSLTGTALWNGRRVTETDTGLVWIYGATPAVWFKAQAMVRLKYLGATTAATPNTVTAMPFDTVGQNDDSGNFTTSTGAGAGVTVNRGGLYLVRVALAFQSGAATDTLACFVMQKVGSNATAYVSETDAVGAIPRIQATISVRVTEGTPVKFQTGYFTSSSAYAYQNDLQQFHTLEVTRIGD